MHLHITQAIINCDRFYGAYTDELCEMKSILILFLSKRSKTFINTFFFSFKYSSLCLSSTIAEIGLHPTEEFANTQIDLFFYIQWQRTHINRARNLKFLSTSRAARERSEPSWFSVLSFKTSLNVFMLRRFVIGYTARYHLRKCKFWEKMKQKERKSEFLLASERDEFEKLKNIMKSRQIKYIRHRRLLIKPFKMSISVLLSGVPFELDNRYVSKNGAGSPFSQFETYCFHTSQHSLPFLDFAY